jgi:hypothetical protein
VSARKRAPKITPLTPYERETVIVFNDEDAVARISTHQRTVLTKLDKNPQAKQVEDLTIGGNRGATFEMPKGLISFRAGRKAKG